MKLFKLATLAGVVGLVVLHEQQISTIANKIVGTFRAAVRIAP